MHIQNAYRERTDYVRAIKRRLATRLKAERLRRGWGRTQMARHLGTDRSVITAVENGKRMPTLDKLFIMLFAVGLEADVIIHEDDHGKGET